MKAHEQKNDMINSRFNLMTSVDVRRVMGDI